MKKVLFIFVMFGLAVTGFGQITAASTTTGSNSGDGEIRAIITQLNANDVLLNTDITTLETINDSYAVGKIVDSSESISVSAAKTWYLITNENKTLWTVTGSGITEAGDSLTISTAGAYTGVLQVSVVASANDTVQIGIHKNAALITGVSEAVSSGTETLNLTLPFYLTLAANDDLTAEIKQAGVDTDNFTIRSANWVIFRRD